MTFKLWQCDMASLPIRNTVLFPSLPSAGAVTGRMPDLFLGFFRSLMLVLFWLMIAAFSGCGGGGGSTSPSNSEPICNNSAANILWTDDIQGGTDSRVGFGYIDLEHPVGTGVPGKGGAINTGSDSNGANASRVADPAGGSGYALRLFSNFGSSASPSSARSEVDLLSSTNSTFAAQAMSTAGVYIAQEWYFPQTLTATGDGVPWINLMDWHAVGGGTGRWHTSPGLFLSTDGSMKVHWQWNKLGFSNSANSSVALPVGRWFPIEMYYKWSTSSVTVQLWIDGNLAITQTVPYTRASDQTGVEFNIKLYGASGSTYGAWSPAPTVRYVRNVRFSDSRITCK